MGYGVKSLLVLREDKFVHRYFPRINISGVMCYVKDESGPIGVAEYADPKEARKRARQEWQRVRSEGRGRAAIDTTESA